MKINLDPFEFKLEFQDILGAGTLMVLKQLQKEINDLTKRIEFLESQYPALQKGVAWDPKPDDMNLQQGRNSPTRKPLQRDHPASSHYWTKKRDLILRNNFNELGPQGIYEKKLLEGFSLAQIRQRCIDLGLMNQYGVKNGS